MAGDSSSHSIRQGQENHTSHEYGALSTSRPRHHGFGQILGTPRKVPPNSVTQASQAKLLGLPMSWHGRDLCAQALFDGLPGGRPSCPLLADRNLVSGEVKAWCPGHVCRKRGRAAQTQRAPSLPYFSSSSPPRPLPPPSSSTDDKRRFFHICSHSAHTCPVTIAGLSPEGWGKVSDPSPIPAVSKNPALSLTPLLQSGPPDLCPGL